MHLALSNGYGLVRRLGRGLLDVVLPPQCLACDASVNEPGSLCAQCFGQFTFITRPFCHVCCLPFETAVIEDEAICGACMKDRPAFRRARAVFTYRETGRSLVLKLKHAARTDAAAHLVKWMQRQGADVLAEADYLVPVPLHWRRLWLRTYNQSALLANALGRATQKPVLADALVRTRPTPSQGGLDRAQRRRNVAGAFRAQRQAVIKGKTVLLIDDVMTTSATADACARALLRAGAAAVDVLVLARVPAPGN
ncbi:MAG: ComF family protein [Rhodospirillaceae bacterium]|nr:ComF family protein [Rhodospirillaceae bacterium]